MSNRSGRSYAITVIAPLRSGIFAWFWKFWLAGVVFPQVRRTVWMMQLPWRWLTLERKRKVVGGWWLPLIVAGALAAATGAFADAGVPGFLFAVIAFAGVFLVGFPLRISLWLLLLAPVLALFTWWFAGWPETSALWETIANVAQYALPGLVMGPVLLLVFWPSTRYQELLYQRGFLHSGQWFLVRPNDIKTANPNARRVRRWSLWFSANFNGPWDPYIEAFSNFLPGGLNLLYRPIEGFPLASPFYAFNRWIRFNQSAAAHYYSAYGPATTKDVRGALTFAGAVRVFVEGRRQWTSNSGAVTNPTRMWAEFDRLLRVLHRDPKALAESDRPRPETSQFPRVSDDGFWRGGVARRNQSGQAYGLNVLTEIDATEQSHLVALLASLSDGGSSPFSELTRVHNARFVLVSDLKHQGRPTLGKRPIFPLASPLGLQAFSNRPLGIDEDGLTSSQLFFSCTFDGENTQPDLGRPGREPPTDGGLSSFLDQLWELRWCRECKRGLHGADRCARGHDTFRLADAIWRRSRGFADGDAFAAHIRKHQIHNSTFFLDSPNPLSSRTFTMLEIVRALAFQERFERFVERVQRCSDPAAVRYVNALAWLIDRAVEARKQLRGFNSPVDLVDIPLFFDLVDRPEEATDEELQAFFPAPLASVAEMPAGDPSAAGATR